MLDIRELLLPSKADKALIYIRVEFAVHSLQNNFLSSPPAQIPSTMQWQIVKRVAELCYFNHDMDGWASELWEEMSEEQRSELPQLGNQQPWIYNPERRAILQAELLRPPLWSQHRRSPLHLRPRRCLWKGLHQRDLPSTERQ